MRGGDRAIMIIVPLLAVVAGFWFLVIGPKRGESSELQSEIDLTRSAIEASEQQIATALVARDEFSENYAELVSLGRAVPEDSDQATLIYDIAGLGKRNDVQFRRFEVSSGASTAPPPPPPPTAEEGEEDASSEDEAETETAAAETPAPATEGAAATLPLGATVGPAGLPVIPYSIRFLGSFFDMASFFHDIDRSVTVSDKDGQPDVRGRLVTIDSFELTEDKINGFPDVEANFSLTTYVVPAEQGLQAGATPAGPAPVGEATPTPVSDGGATP